jgi:biopolymer transport protein ExbB
MMTKALGLATSVAAAWVLYARQEVLHRGGPVMIPILFCSLFGTALVAAKFRQLVLLRPDMDRFLKDIFERLDRQRIKDAIDLCDKEEAPVSRVLKAGIVKYDQSKEEIREALDDAFLFEVPLLEEFMGALTALVQVIPLLGLLGSLVGFMRIFQVVVSRTSGGLAVTVADVASGIWQVLLPAAAGFCVVVPLLLAHHYFHGRIQFLTREIEASASDLLNTLLERRGSL